MIARPFACTGLLAFALVGPAHAEPSVELPQLFPRRAEVQIAQPGLQSLEIPIEILRACRPGLADLRLWSDGREVPYLVDTTGPEAWTLAEKQDAKIGVVLKDAKAPLCEPQAERAHCISFEIETPKTGHGWTLVFDLPGAQIAERVDAAIRRNGKLEPLVQGQSIYRLPGPGERMRLPLPDDAVGKKIIVALKGEGAAPTPALRFERGDLVPGAQSLETPLSIASEWRGRDGTHLYVERPRGVLPTALKIETRTGTFDRRVRVYDSNGADARNVIGQGKLLRITQHVAGAAIAIDQVEIPLGAARYRGLEVVIEDGDSPRLDGLALRATVRRPVLVFDRSGTEPVELFYGGGRVEAPRYDLQSLLPSSVDGDGEDGLRAQIAARLRVREGLAHATLGPTAANPRFQSVPALAAVARAGAPVDLALYERARRLRVAASPDGLSRYVLSAEDLAASRPDLRDVRVVDEAGRQWPYLIDREVPPQVISIARPTGTSREGKTRYPIALPVGAVQASRLELEITEPFFDRTIVLVGHDEAGREHRSAPLSLSRKLEDRAPASLPVDLPRLTALELEITDGGDAPLTLEQVRLHLPTAALQLVATAGAYQLLVGDPEANAPSYELRALEPLLAQLDAAPVTVEALTANPRYSQAAKLRAGGERDRLIVGLVLGAAVVVLGLLTLRMARREAEPSGDA